MTSKPGCQSITQSQTFCQAPLAQHSDREPCEFRLTMPTMIPEKEARNKRLRRSILRLGSDFAGLDTAAWALRVLGIPFEHTFAADIDRSSRKVLSYMGAKTIYMDVTTRPATKAPSVDLYTFGPPVPAFQCCWQPPFHRNFGWSPSSAQPELHQASSAVHDPNGAGPGCGKHSK